MNAKYHQSIRCPLKNYMIEKIQDSSARTTKIIISHFPIVQAILPTNPSSIRMIAIMMKIIPRVRSQLAIQIVSSDWPYFNVWPEIPLKMTEPATAFKQPSAPFKDEKTIHNFCYLADQAEWLPCKPD